MENKPTEKQYALIVNENNSALMKGLKNHIIPYYSETPSCYIIKHGAIHKHLPKEDAVIVRLHFQNAQVYACIKEEIEVGHWYLNTAVLNAKIKYGKLIEKCEYGHEANSCNAKDMPPCLRIFASSDKKLINDGADGVLPILNAGELMPKEKSNKIVENGVEYDAVCPITGRKFFMTLEHPDYGVLPTYGGPYDSYTIPVPDEDNEGEYLQMRYDHDEGGWVESESFEIETPQSPAPVQQQGESDRQEAMKWWHSLSDRAKKCIRNYTTTGREIEIIWRELVSASSPKEQLPVHPKELYSVDEIMDVVTVFGDNPDINDNLQEQIIAFFKCA